MKPFDVRVRGAGIVGRSLALSLARAGMQVALQPQPARASAQPDVRAYALNAASVALLRGLKVWDALPAGAATAVHEMRVHGDATGAMLEFSAWQQRVAELTWITDAAVLERELERAVQFAPHITVVDADAGADVPATLTAVCEGKASATRAAYGVAFEQHDYGQVAIAARLIASRPHHGVAQQWFGGPDVLALLPFTLPDQVQPQPPAPSSSPSSAYALVWSLPQARAQDLLAQDAAAFEQALLQATGGAAGELRLASDRAAWPLTLARAEAWCGPGWVLLGDAAHVVHPLAGQGLNLGLGDVTALCAVIAAREPWRSLGDEKLLRRYARERAAPTWAMGQVTDGLQRLFSTTAPGAAELRNRGLTLVNHLPPLKRWLAARALDS
ncbi:MAG: 2-octaprenyl-3-methyl-6-methoxy-1,4-benzoquinol hydroxylase [Methylibium sp. NZG]|nr:MAG: 2-octaprenyl-3-methyl-6-methoxy-1,4-benzoquinol hydroxylase [Methylibium sp. NZG]